MTDFIPKLTVNSSSIPKRTKKRISNILPGWESALAAERHGYAKGPSHPDGFSIPQIEILCGKVESFGEEVNRGRYIRFRQKNSSYQIYFKKLVLASGTIGNAILMSSLTGEEYFSFGNHISGTLGPFPLAAPRNLNKIYQSFAHQERDFVTFCTIRNRGYSHCAIRLIPVQKVLLKELWKRLIFERSSRSSKEVFWRQALFLGLDTISRLLLGKRLEYQYKVRILAEIPLSTASNLRVKKEENDEFLAEVRLSLSQEVLNEIEDLIFNFLKFLKLPDSSANRKSVAASVKEIRWEDCGHYFGTVPVSNSSLRPSVDGNLRLRSNRDIYVLGNSAHPIGSHGHPTGLTILLAARLAVHLQEVISG